MNPRPVKKILAVLLCALLSSPAVYASPWAEKQTYGGKTAGKFLFGLKNSLLGWTAIFTQPADHKYDLKKTAWEGMCNGIAETLLFTGTGLLHLATFPIPADIPDIGNGVLPDLGKKKGPPKPWEVNGRSKYQIVPASEVKGLEKKEAEEPEERQEPVIYRSSSSVAVPAPVRTTAPATPEPELIAAAAADPQTTAQAPVQISVTPSATPTASSDQVDQEPAAVPSVIK